MSTFTQSEHVGELITALAKAQAEFTPAIKDSENPFFKSKYADLAANLNAVRPALNRNGIAIIQADSSDLSRGAAIVRTSLHCGEQWLAVEAEAPALDHGGNINVQTIGSAWTYLRRYTLQALCGLASEDDDGNSLSGGTGKVTPASVAKPPQNSFAPPDYEPDLPSENTFSQPPAKQTAQPSTQAPAPPQTASQDPQQYPYAILAGTTLTCTPITITEKKRTVPKTEENPEGTQPYIFVYFKGNVKTISEFSCFDTGLFEAIRAGLNHECQFKVEVKEKAGKMYINVKDAMWIDNAKYVEGKPVNMDAEPA